MNFYIKNNLMNQDIENQIIRNFNRIWNSMQKEYDTFFSQKYIDDIVRCVDTEFELLKYIYQVYKYTCNNLK